MPLLICGNPLSQILMIQGNTNDVTKNVRAAGV